MVLKCYLSFKTEAFAYKENFFENLKVDLVDKSLHDATNFENENYIKLKIREDYLWDSTVTRRLIGSVYAEMCRWEAKKFIMLELQSSLYHSESNTQNEILGDVLPSIYEKINSGSGICSNCGNSHTYESMSKNSIVKEFSYNYYVSHNKRYWTEDYRFCVLVKWKDFGNDTEKSIGQAFRKRAHLISLKTKGRP